MIMVKGMEKAFNQMTKEEQKAFNLKGFNIKSEYEGGGPLWAESHDSEYDEFWDREIPKSVRFEDGEHYKDRITTRWYTFNQAKHIAKSFGVNLNIH
jgi:hypothetical protein